jgi:hypothetical protein
VRVSFWLDEVKALLHCTKHHAVHVLRKEMTGPNAAARVAAARTLLADETTKPLNVPNAALTSGVTIVIEAPAAPVISHTAAPLIEIPARPVETT